MALIYPWGEYVAVIATATLASIGTAGVPGVGLITLAMVLQQVGLPVEGIGFNYWCRSTIGYAENSG